jgi:conjugative transposon TraM protein
MNRSTARTKLPSWVNWNSRRRWPRKQPMPKAREQEALKELERALAEARLKGTGTGRPDYWTTALKSNTDTSSCRQRDNRGRQPCGKCAIRYREAGRNGQESKSHFRLFQYHSPTMNTSRTLSKQSLTRNVKAVEGSRVRLRLLDDVEINETVVKSGSYLYAIMSGFSSQRVKGTIGSVLVNDEIIKVNLALYDTDGLEGLYVPSSSFRETAKDVASGAFNSNMSMNTGNNWEQPDPMGYAGYSGCLPEDK